MKETKRCFDCGKDCDEQWMCVGVCPECERAARERHVKAAVGELEKAQEELKAAGWYIENALQHLGGM